jgi:hypothetical protein
VALELELPPGACRAEWVDTMHGSVAKAEQFEHPGGLRKLEAPPFSEDIALRVRTTGR